MPILSDGLLELTLVAQHVAEIVVRLKEAGLESDSALILCRRLIELALPLEDETQVVVGLGKIGAESDRVLEMCRGLVELALAEQDVAQVIVRFGDVGPNRQNLAISRGRLDQPPGTMFAERQGNQGVKLGLRAGRLAGRRHQVLSSLVCHDSDPIIASRPWRRESAPRRRASRLHGLGNPLKDVRPSAERGLAEESHAGIPGRVVA